MKQLTIFTPTYNRAFLLNRLYQSLLKQTSNCFIWIIVDDGSSDGTFEIVQSWKRENKIEIIYRNKENGGMHTGHNVAISLLTTPYAMCVDSDDYLLDISVERILNLINNNNLCSNDNLCGLIGLNVTKDGSVVGTEFPQYLFHSKYQDLSKVHKAYGDKKIVFKTDYLKQLEAYPIFENEKFVPLYHPIVLDENFDYLCINEPICIVEYQNDGSTINIYQQYFRHPRGFRHSRKIEFQYFYDFKSKFKSIIHLTTSNIILNDSIFKESPNYLFTLLSLPFSLVWYIIISKKKDHKRNIENYLK